MAETKKIAKPKKASPIIDIVEPGKTPASPTSKPVISHHPTLKDPMVVEEKPASETDESQSQATPGPLLTAPSANKLKIEPLHPELAKTLHTAESIDEVVPETTAQQETDSVVVEEGSKPQPQKIEDITASNLNTSAITTEDIADTVTDITDTKQVEADEKAAAERQAALQQAVESRKYFLPINEVEKRRRAYVWGSLIALVLGLVWLDVALDAGIISIAGVKAPTHLFSAVANSTAASVVTTPASTTKTYVSKIDKTSFRYPSAWKLNKIDAANDYISLDVSDNAATKPSIATIYFSRNLTSDTPLALTNSTVAAVSYQKIPASSATSPLYLQEFIMKNTSPNTSVHYLNYLNITSTQNLQVGDIISPAAVTSKTFSAPNGDKLKFTATLVMPDLGSALGTSSLQSAQNFMKSDSTYKQVKNVLLSLKLPKT